MLAALGLAYLSTGTAQAKRVPVPRVYVFGLAASFSDSIVYFTNIQTLENAWIDKKNKFLQSRDTYSYQLREYLGNTQQMPRRTCMVFYDLKRQKLEKKLQKMKRLYVHPKPERPTFDVRYLKDDDFKFEVIDLSEEIAMEEQQEAEYKQMKKEQKAEKKKKKDKKDKKEKNKK